MRGDELAVVPANESIGFSSSSVPVSPDLEIFLGVSTMWEAF